jgi:hypothetical protein
LTVLQHVAIICHAHRHRAERNVYSSNTKCTVVLPGLTTSWDVERVLAKQHLFMVPKSDGMRLVSNSFQRSHGNARLASNQEKSQ